MIAVMSGPSERVRRETEDPRSGSLRHDLGALFTEFAPPLYRALYAFSGRRATLAEDVTAETFARAVAYQDRIRDPRAWLYKTAFRIAAAELRDERRREEERPEADWDAPHGLAEISDALQQLPQQQRAAVVLRYVCDFTTRETASAMGVSAATVRVHLFRARKRLRDLLGDEEA